MPEVAPIAVGTTLVVGDPPTQSLSQLLVPRTTMFGSFGGGSQQLSSTAQTADAAPLSPD